MRSSAEPPGLTPWLVLFDIDGTLVRCGPQIRDIFQSALESIFGTSGPIGTYSFAGRTDFGIVLDLMTAAGLEPAQVRQLMGEFEDEYIARLEERLEAALMDRLPGVPELLEQLTARPDVQLGLLTGNFERGARVKLSRFDLNGYFPFGAFGDRAMHRNELPPVALERARLECGGAVTRSRVLIVGDSILDVECARAHGIDSIAVATGFTSRADLEQAGADLVLSDLSELAGRHEAFSPDTDPRL